MTEGAQELPEALAHYARQVLRLRVGDEIVLLDGEGAWSQATITGVQKREVTAKLGPVHREAQPAGLRLHLLQAVGKRDKMDTIVRQCAELGVSSFQPVLTERCVARQEGRLHRWQEIADDALRVSGAFHRMRISPVCSLADALHAQATPRAMTLALGAQRSLKRALDASPNIGSLTLLLGPEGGLSAPEIEAAAAAGFEAVHMGARTLRMETAGPTAATIVLAWAGLLGA